MISKWKYFETSIFLLEFWDFQNFAEFSRYIFDTFWLYNHYTNFISFPVIYTFIWFTEFLFLHFHDFLEPFTVIKFFWKINLVTKELIWLVKKYGYRKKTVIENIVLKHKRVDICFSLFNTTFFIFLLK